MQESRWEMLVAVAQLVVVKERKGKERKMKSLSRVRLFVTPWIVAYQAPPSMGFKNRILSIF